MIQNMFNNAIIHIMNKIIKCEIAYITVQTCALSTLLPCWRMGSLCCPILQIISKETLLLTNSYVRLYFIYVKLGMAEKIKSQ